VGDQSDFVNMLSRVLTEAGPKLGAALSDAHFRYFCDKLGASFAPRFAEALFRCRRISEAGSQQLLLDTQAIRGLLLELPSSGACSCYACRLCMLCCACHFEHSSASGSNTSWAPSPPPVIPALCRDPGVRSRDLRYIIQP
jgi:hypothetical protein